MTDLVMTIYSDEEIEQESDGEFGFDEGNKTSYQSDHIVNFHSKIFQREI